MVLHPSAALKIASYGIQPPEPPAKERLLRIDIDQSHHRIALINAWGPSVFRPGGSLLEIGCGQGTCTQALAEAVAFPPDPSSVDTPADHSTDSEVTQGRIDALDPGPPDYGAPFTLAQAQAHLLSGPLGEIVRFHNTDPVSFLSSSSSSSQNWDAAILAHCIWYFPSASELHSILTSLKGRVKRVCIAEWSLSTSHPEGQAHVLAALARGLLEAYRRSEENIRTLLGPEGIKEVAGRAGWRVENEGVVVPEEGLDDGRWEVGGVLAKGEGGFLQVVEGLGDDVDERVKTVMRSAWGAVDVAVKALPGGLKDVRSMDVWVATLVEA